MRSTAPNATPSTAQLTHLADAAIFSQFPNIGTHLRVPRPGELEADLAAGALPPVAPHGVGEAFDAVAVVCPHRLGSDPEYPLPWLASRPADELLRWRVGLRCGPERAVAAATYETIRLLSRIHLKGQLPRAEDDYLTELKDYYDF